MTTPAKMIQIIVNAFFCFWNLLVILASSFPSPSFIYSPSSPSHSVTTVTPYPIDIDLERGIVQGVQGDGTRNQSTLCSGRIPALRRTPGETPNTTTVAASRAPAPESPPSMNIALELVTNHGAQDAHCTSFSPASSPEEVPRVSSTRAAVDTMPASVPTHPDAVPTTVLPNQNINAEAVGAARNGKLDLVHSIALPGQSDSNTRVPLGAITNADLGASTHVNANEWCMSLLNHSINKIPTRRNRRPSPRRTPACEDLHSLSPSRKAFSTPPPYCGSSPAKSSDSFTVEISEANRLPINTIAPNPKSVSPLRIVKRNKGSCCRASGPALQAHSDENKPRGEGLDDIVSMVRSAIVEGDETEDKENVRDIFNRNSAWECERLPRLELGRMGGVPEQNGDSNGEEETGRRSVYTPPPPYPALFSVACVMDVKDPADAKGGSANCFQSSTVLKLDYHPHRLANASVDKSHLEDTRKEGKAGYLRDVIVLSRRQRQEINMKNSISRGPGVDVEDNDDPYDWMAVEELGDNAPVVGEEHWGEVLALNTLTP